MAEAMFKTNETCGITSSNLLSKSFPLQYAPIYHPKGQWWKKSLHENYQIHSKGLKILSPTKQRLLQHKFSDTGKPPVAGHDFSGTTYLCKTYFIFPPNKYICLQLWVPDDFAVTPLIKGRTFLDLLHVHAPFTTSMATIHRAKSEKKEQNSNLLDRDSWHMAQRKNGKGLCIQRQMLTYSLWKHVHLYINAIAYIIYVSVCIHACVHLRVYL